MNLWVYKVRNDPDTEYNAYGDGESVFAEPWSDHAWGGAWASSRADDKRIFDDEVERGDLVLAWQSDLSAAIGLCEVTGSQPSEHYGLDLVLRPVERFSAPVKLHVLKRTTHLELQKVQALKQGHIRTIYPTSSKEARLLLAACGSERRVRTRGGDTP